MAKRKSRNQSKPWSPKTDDWGRTEILGVNIKQFGITLASVLIGEIVETAIERLIQKIADSNAAHKNSGDFNESDAAKERHLSNSHDTLEDTALELPERQEIVQDTSSTIKDALEAVKASVREITPTLADVVEPLKDIPQRVLQQSVGSVENATDMAVEGVVGTFRNVIDTVNSNDVHRTRKKSKKKGKKKNKKSQ